MYVHKKFIRGGSSMRANVTMSLDVKVLKQFQRVARLKGRAVSLLVEEWMRRYLKKRVDRKST